MYTFYRRCSDAAQVDQLAAGPGRVVSRVRPDCEQTPSGRPGCMCGGLSGDCERVARAPGGLSTSASARGSASRSGPSAHSRRALRPAMQGPIATPSSKRMRSACCGQLILAGAQVTRPSISFDFLVIDSCKQAAETRPMWDRRRHSPPPLRSSFPA
jgi:hypothetical protein